MLANSVQKFAEFCFQDFEPVVFINLNCSFDYSFAAISNEFLMFSSLEIMELTLRAEILALNCMLLIGLIYVGCSIDILSEPFLLFFLTANLNTARTKKILFISAFKFSSGFPAI